MRLVAVMVVLLALGMHLHFIMIPALSSCQFWLAIGAFALLLVAGR